ncbi:MAG: CoA-binding protein [bacterium]|nr:CoA-binding protein [bacterium]
MLKAFIKPKTIAIVGATNRSGSVGLALVKNLLKSKAQLFFVNPNKKILFRKKCFASLTDIKEGVDLVVIAVPSNIVPQVAKECVLKQVKAVIIISANFAETGQEGKTLEENVSCILKTASIPFLGPNCFGLLRTRNNLNATFSALTPKKGGVAFLSQSGALINVFIEKSLNTSSGFSLIVSLGNMADLGFADWFDYLKDDEETKAVALYLEGLKEKAGKSFIEKAKALSSLKPILVLKAGITTKGKEASQSHSASLAGENRIYSAVFRKANIFEVETLEELFEISSAFALLPFKEKSVKAKKSRVAVLTNGGGLGVLASDYLSAYGVNDFSLKDLIGTATKEDYAQAIESSFKKGGADILLAIVSSQMMTNPEAIAQEIVKCQKKFPQKIIISCFLTEEQGKTALTFLKINKQIVFNNLRIACLFVKLLNGKI